MEFLLCTIRKYKNMPKLLVKIRHTKGVKQIPKTPCNFFVKKMFGMAWTINNHKKLTPPMTPSPDTISIIFHCHLLQQKCDKRTLRSFLCGAIESTCLIGVGKYLLIRIFIIIQGSLVGQEAGRRWARQLSCGCGF